MFNVKLKLFNFSSESFGKGTLTEINSSSRGLFKTALILVNSIIEVESEIFNDGSHPTLFGSVKSSGDRMTDPSLVKVPDKGGKCSPVISVAERIVHSKVKSYPFLGITISFVILISDPPESP